VKVGRRRPRSLSPACHAPDGMEPCRLATQELTISLDVAKDAGLKILIVDESPIRAAILEEGLRESGYAQVVQIR